ncbi:hypothetical protein HZC34_02830 [Candidatus Saganbacteria bacterium]|nr:hypothetical protein [Candidatus Saganbacteria bacterium]
MVPEQKRIHKDFVWLSKNMVKLQKKYAGLFYAIVNEKVSVGKSAVQAYNKSKKLFPDNEPLMGTIPTMDSLIL